MAKFQIPETYLPGFDALVELEDSQVVELASALRDIPVGTGPRVFQDAISNKFPIDGIRSIARTVFSLGSILTAYEGTIDELASELSTAYHDARSESLTIEEDIERKLKLIFTDCGNLKLTSKALSLLTENKHIYRESKILTDIRLVFNDHLEEGNRNAVILHSLKIEYLSNGDYKEFFTTLDSLDLKKLKDQIDRALEKERLICNDYNNISFIEISE